MSQKNKKDGEAPQAFHWSFVAPSTSRQLKLLRKPIHWQAPDSKLMTYVSKIAAERFPGDQRLLAPA